MATARSTTNSDIHSQLNGYVTDYLTKHMYDANTSWPLRKTIRLPKQPNSKPITRTSAPKTKPSATGTTTPLRNQRKTKIISNGIVRQTSQLIDSVTIPDLNTALNITTPQTRKLYQREHQRAHTITNQFNLDSNTSINIAKILKNHDDTDFNLVIQAAHYFANHNTENMTPRMVPIPGFSAKWLGKTTSNRCKAICKLLKREQLALNDRHGEIRLRLLDTQHHNQPDLIVTQPWTDGAPHDITHIIIVENKDTYQAIPTIEHANLHIRQRTRGNPNQNTTTLDHNHTPHHLLGRHRRRRPRNTLRTTTNRHHLRLHTHGQHSIQNIRTIRHQTRHQKTTPQTRDPKPTPGLTQHERNLYEQLCTGKNTTYLRIEQERIPINDAMTILHNQHQWNTTHHK